MDDVCLCVCETEVSVDGRSAIAEASNAWPAKQSCCVCKQFWQTHTNESETLMLRKPRSTSNTTLRSSAGTKVAQTANVSVSEYVGRLDVGF